LARPLTGSRGGCDVGRQVRSSFLHCNPYDSRGAGSRARHRGENGRGQENGGETFILSLLPKFLVPSVIYGSDKISDAMNGFLDLLVFRIIA
jgi:hypothetical protein